jgi:Xaa-Pro dipeptidase
VEFSAAMPLHFTPAEYAARQAQARAAVQAAGLDALLMFAPESHYWISGYDTFGFAMFQCMVLTAKGELHLLTRTPDLAAGAVDLDPFGQ